MQKYLYEQQIKLLSSNAKIEEQLDSIKYSIDQLRALGEKFQEEADRSTTASESSYESFMQSSDEEGELAERGLEKYM